MSVAAAIVAAVLLGAVTPGALAAHDTAARPDVAMDAEGNVFVSQADGKLWRRDTGSDEWRVIALIEGRSEREPGPVGITTGVDGQVYAAVSSDDATVNGVWRVDAITGATTHLEGSELIDGPSDVAAASDGTLYATDTGAGSVWVLRPGEPAAVWSADPLLRAVDGTQPHAAVDMRTIAVADDLVYVGGHDGIVIIAIPIEADGSAGAAGVSAQLSDPIGGLDVNATGELLAVHPQADRASLVYADGTFEVIAGADDGLDEPSSVALLDRDDGALTAVIVNAAHDPADSSGGSSVVSIDVMPSAPDGGITGPDGAGATLTVEAGDLWFAPSELTIPSDVPTTLELVGVGNVPHNLVIKELGVLLNVSPGTTSSVTLSDVSPGTYRFYCGIFGHSRAGMIGTLIVE